MISPEKIAEMLAAAEKATPGKWYAQIWRHSGGADTICIKDETGEELIAWTGFDGVAYTKAQIRANAKHVANCGPATITEILSELLTLGAERDEARELAERLKLEAQGHAMEARTANSTIYEIYQVVSGATGEPGNWHGAEPVRERFAALEAQLARQGEALKALVNAEALSGVRAVVAGWNGENSPVGPFPRHPSALGATLPKTTCGAVYALDEAMQAARSTLSTEDSHG